MPLRPKKNLQEVTQFLTEVTGLNFSVEQAKNLLALYPQVRINIAYYNGISRTAVRDSLGFALAHFFLGCSWPKIGDKVDLVRFVELLQEQAVQMGFEKIQNTDVNV